MKRLLTFILTVILCMTFCSCGGKKKAFNISKEAYNNVNASYEIIENFGADVYEAWRIGIYDADKSGFGLSELAEELHLTEDELKIGVAYLFNAKDWDTMTENEKITEKLDATSNFRLALKALDSKFSLCVGVVSAAYEATGKSAEAQKYLDTAKEQMKALSENYSDYEHYPSLKEYYTTTSSFFEFCQNPTGSFKQVQTTIEDYRNSARNCCKDLEFVFED